MRLTLFDATRGIEELQAMSPEQRDRVVLRARHWHKGSPGCGCVITLLVLMWLIVLVAPMVTSALFGTAGEDWLGLVAAGLLVAAVVLSLRVRDLVFRRMLRAQLERVRCRACGVHMMGAARSADMVRCRGCGALHRYAEVEIEDFGPPLLVLDENTRCPQCSYAWAGLARHAGRVRCPECGREEEVVVKGEPQG